MLAKEKFQAGSKNNLFPISDSFLVYFCFVTVF